MIAEREGLLEEVRARFAHVEACPLTGERIFFENAGGALTLNAVVSSSAFWAGVPDNQGRANEASKELMAVIDRGKADMRLLMNAPDGDGHVFVGESGTEVLFRLIRTALVGCEAGGSVIGTTLEHPASRSALQHWAEVTDRERRLAVHDDATGTVGPDAFAAVATPDTRVMTIVHTSPVTGMGVDVAACVKAVRAVAPECLVIVDGIQHACHGHIDIAAIGADGYAISPYKLFSRHGYGVGYASDRLTAFARERLVGGPETAWEFGTRDTGAYATFSDVVEHFEWLGSHFTDSDDRRARIEAAAKAIHKHETSLTDAMLHGTGNLKGLADLPGVHIVGGVDNAAREGLVSFWMDGRDAPSIVAALEADGIRTHTRKADHYSGNVLEPLGLEGCVRVSLAHYNTKEEVARLLSSMAKLAEGA